ncbi:lysophospholipid acyltransferase family protein [Ramlibacter rhizophilus]|uniref:1-acyl-sn-glycerol-3-phosphate acyltransferase n=1 Tax=Ramlibacter rhizophilus TaxID=1781167 RepID=A0A4Z0BP32_9BURK|nr:lysophospholipid acyltransferase family protein [Ramlibacter rhizophilus]TFZ01076.1 1-acyl-sn-glycerol-3-phosphate acyltransferase [Ramlibacter rhizophilus]
MRSLRASWKLARALGMVLSGLMTLAFVFPRLSAGEREARVQAWAERTLQVLGVGLEVRGVPAAQGPVLLVANHISWLDILVLHAARYCRFVSKADVRRWPLIGRLAEGAGTLFIERESRRDALRVVHHMAERLRAGDVLAVFPEGTTSNGIALLPFHANLLQAAISADVPAQPVALVFLDAASRQPTTRACYIGDDSLVGSLWRTLGGAPIVAVVHFGQPEAAQARDRRLWAEHLRERVDELRRI